MILSDFLSKQKHDDSNPHEILPIWFNMQCKLQDRYYNLGKGNVGKYLLQTCSQKKSSGIKLPEVHGVGKGYSGCKSKRSITDKTKDRSRKKRFEMSKEY